MNKTNNLKKDQKISSFVLQKYLASGGNGEVWLAKNIEGQDVAIKFLTRMEEKRYKRFTDEITIVKKNSDIEGILPIIEYHLPEKPNTVVPYYIMPLAEPLSKVLKNKSTTEIIEYMIEVADTLSELHKRGISHRDIKPANLLFYKGRVNISDFGLVDFPDKRDITRNSEDVGPKWTMAPEMRRNAVSADGIKADSYSFSKTLWILITKNKKGFDGKYSPDEFLGLKNYITIAYYQSLDELLIECTDNEPNNRPNAKKISDGLKEWIKINNDYSTSNKLQWKDIQNKIFPSGTPIRAIWEQVGDIINILNELTVTDNLNHIFFPTGGGLNLLGVKKSHEDGCIELDVGYTIILKPKRLVFESFNFKEEWNYFRLESNELATSGYYPNVNEHEYLTELEPLVYTDVNCFEYNDYNGNILPKGARIIDRVLKGNFVIFQNTSIYNKVSSTYDARHNKMTTDEFRKYICDAVKQILESKKFHQEKLSAIKLIRPSSFRSKNRLLKVDEIEIIKKVISFAKDRDIEDLEIQKKHGIGDFIDPFDKSAIEYSFEQRPKSDLLEDYLKNLSQDQLALVAAVMYGGRDGIPPDWGVPLDEMIRSFIKDNNLIDSISEKSPLIEYLERGIRLYGEE